MAAELEGNVLQPYAGFGIEGIGAGAENSHAHLRGRAIWHSTLECQ
jgi:hypothetical protein